ncbi:Oidioi.mRNA.OKI2018_I69.PAR.g12905.t1.cds [Oikopleura dioica]|uniref:Oidioi.mRNA.OKI2018_I69.PAR.g12905.t1.cds n=1 Tax=Oikopleura dioica TaxID=34765 RepID=A0ABN7S625_OIKDI|nr:Oidioi.mRNA.OKI2018_I69.PAR.g12905.t1.cds [Oikopleura dioica]
MEQEISYFQNYKEQPVKKAGDIRFNLNAEEKSRIIPVRVNSSYGHRPFYDTIIGRENVRINHCRDFLSKNGIGL